MFSIAAQAWLDEKSATTALAAARLDWRRLPENRSCHARKPQRRRSPMRSAQLPVTLDDIEAARRAPDAAPSSRPTATGAARCRTSWAARSGSSSRTCSSRPPSRSAAPSTASRRCRPRGEQARRDRHVGRQPRARRRLSRAAASASRPPSSCPCNTPTVKVVNTRRHGAEVILHGETVEEAAAFAHEHGRERGPDLHPPLRRSAGDRRPGHASRWRCWARRPRSTPWWCRSAAAG